MFSVTCFVSLEKNTSIYQVKTVKGNIVSRKNRVKFLNLVINRKFLMLLISRNH